MFADTLTDGIAKQFPGQVQKIGGSCLGPLHFKLLLLCVPRSVERVPQGGAAQRQPERAGSLWRSQMPVVTQKMAHQRLDTGAVDENRKRDHDECQLDEVHGQIFGEAMLDGVHQVVQ